MNRSFIRVHDFYRHMKVSIVMPVYTALSAMDGRRAQTTPELENGFSPCLDNAGYE